MAVESLVERNDILFLGLVAHESSGKMCDRDTGRQEQANHQGRAEEGGSERDFKGCKYIYCMHYVDTVYTSFKTL